MSYDEQLNAILDSYENLCYPDAFLNEYDIMECLSDHNGVCTFLVQNKHEELFVAKCYDKNVWTISDKSDVLKDLDHPGLPVSVAVFENDKMTVTIRGYIEGTSLDRYAKENDLSEREIINICLKLCDIMGYLHHRKDPIIHRDIKPQNIIVKPDSDIVLIDFDIARVYRKDNDTDTMFFGTLAYAPPEQYGFSQTDARTDIYSFGILLRWLLTGSTRENRNIKIYRPLARIIDKCTGFAPHERFSDVDQVKKALKNANPKAQIIRNSEIAACLVLAVVIISLLGIKVYKTVTYSPFTEDAVPGFLSDEERVEDAVSYMKNKYATDMFDETDRIANIGDLRRVLMELYELDHDYVYELNTDMPQENDAYVLPWGWDDKQTLDKEIAAYAAIKVHDPSIVADWSSLKDDNGFYPGVRVAVAFAEKNDITAGVNRPGDITLGDMALIFANTDRVFETVQSE